MWRLPETQSRQKPEDQTRAAHKVKRRNLIKHKLGMQQAWQKEYASRIRAVRMRSSGDVHEMHSGLLVVPSPCWCTVNKTGRAGTCWDIRSALFQIRALSWNSGCYWRRHTSPQEYKHGQEHTLRNSKEELYVRKDVKDSKTWEKTIKGRKWS